MSIEKPSAGQRDLFDDDPLISEMTRSELEATYASLFGAYPDTQLTDDQLRTAVEFPEQETERLRLSSTPEVVRTLSLDDKRARYQELFKAPPGLMDEKEIDTALADPTRHQAALWEVALQDKRDDIDQMYRRKK
jgi:hypothetical protein